MIQKIFFVFLFSLFALSSSPAPHQSRAGKENLILKMKIIGIKDGDTVEALYYQLPITIRLEHIDAPEKKQAFGAASKKKLSDLCFGKIVTVISKGKKGSYDARGRLIAEIYINDRICANKEMVKAGLAWHYKKYSTDNQYEQLENLARKQRAGLWIDKHPVAPWNFRR